MQNVSLLCRSLAQTTLPHFKIPQRLSFRSASVRQRFESTASFSTSAEKSQGKEEGAEEEQSSDEAVKVQGCKGSDKFPLPLYDAELERLTPEERKEKAELIKELTRRLSGPLADENGNVPVGKDRPTAIEVDGPSHFYANSTRYTAYTKLKHRLLTRMGYRVLHVPYFEWRKMRGAREREEYMREKLKEEPTEWLDPEDEKYYKERMEALEAQYKKDAAKIASSEAKVQS